jgi:hypothetical protein
MLKNDGEELCILLALAESDTESSPLDLRPIPLKHDPALSLCTVISNPYINTSPLKKQIDAYLHPHAPSPSHTSVNASTALTP